MLGKQKGKIDMVDNSEIKRITTPISRKDIQNLGIGDIVSINGLIVTARDKAHKFLVHEKPDKKDIPLELDGGIIYHCGPIIKDIEMLLAGGSEEKNLSLITHYPSLKVVAAGPTTSMRVEMYEADIIKTYGIRAIIGKGGMGDKTLNAMKENGCVYFHTISGAATYLAERIVEVVSVWKLEEFGMTEAMWLFKVEDFPAIVTMDANGNSLHKDIEEASLRKLKEMVG